MREYQRLNRNPTLNGVFPIYASHGAWSRAQKHVERLREIVISDSTVLLRNWYGLIKARGSSPAQFLVLAGLDSRYS